MIWAKTSDPDLIVSPPYFIRRSRNGSGWRYVLGVDTGPRLAECLGGFDTADEAKARAGHG